MADVEDSEKIELKSPTDELSAKLSVGADYFTSILGSAWSKTAKTASEGAAFLSFATGPDDEGERPIRDVVDDDEKKKMEEEEEEDVMQDDLKNNTDDDDNSLSSFISTAMTKVGTGIKESVSSYSLFSVVDKAKNVLSDGGKMIEEFNKEQENFIKSKRKEEEEEKSTASSILPWSGYESEAELQKRILSLSEDKRNFMNGPPEGVTFDFHYSEVTHIAEALLNEDPGLKSIRYGFVPKLMNEQVFWRNYFYRVNLIKQCYDLKDIREYVAAKDVPEEDALLPTEENIVVEETGGDEEFVSDSFQASRKDLDEATASIQKLEGRMTEDELEVEMDKLFREYEFVNEEPCEEQIKAVEEEVKKWS